MERQFSSKNETGFADLTRQPLLTADVETRWGDLVDGLRRDGLDLLHQASASASPESASPRHPIYELADQVMEDCPEEAEVAEAVLRSILARHGREKVAKSA